MSWLSFLNKRKAKSSPGGSQVNEMKRIFFLKQAGTNLYIHPAGKHLFDSSAYALKEGKVCVLQEQIEPFADLFLQEGNVRLVSEEIKPEMATC